MIETAHLKMIPCEIAHFEAIFTGDEALAQLLGAQVTPGWYEFPGIAGIEAIRFSYDQLLAHPDLAGWWLYLAIHTADNLLVGMGGYKGKVNDAGVVEIGYAIIPDYRCQGLATEIARGMIDRAFTNDAVQFVDAHTLAELNASARVLTKAGMSHIGTVNDPDEGEIWHWRIVRGSDVGP